MACQEKSVRFTSRKRKHDNKSGYCIIENGKLVFQKWPQTSVESITGPTDSHLVSQINNTPVPAADDLVTSRSSSTDPAVHGPDTEGDEIHPRNSNYVKQKIKLSARWSEIRDELVQELVSNAYPATFACCKCTVSSTNIFRCQDCGPTAYFCEECCDEHHTRVYLHIPEMWNPELQCFEDRHHDIEWKRPDGHQCVDCFLTQIIVVDDKGRQHYPKVEICKSQSIPSILVKYGLWPASPSVPRVAFTFDFMLSLKAMVLEAQVSLHAFCTAMQQCRPGLQKNLNADWIPDLYRIISWESVLNFFWVHHNITHLQFADIDFPDGTECPVCPEHGDGEGRRLAMDGNMNLVHRAKAGHSVRDPLHNGRFFLPQAAVDEYLNGEEASTNRVEQDCSNFQASSVIRSKNKTAKLDFTGAFAAICSHDFPAAIFNIRHGERMGYPIFMLQSLDNISILMYDLGCQLEKSLKKRSISYLATIGVGVWHAYGHKMGCQLQYSPRHTFGAGLFDGEGTERLWSYLGKFALITKEMTPENRTDLIVEALLNYGGRLTRKMGGSLGRRLERAYMLQESTADTMKKDLLGLPGVTEKDIASWGEEEKACASKQQSRTQTSWQGQYARHLHEYYSYCEELQDEAADDEDVIRLEAALKKVERKQKIKDRWRKTSDKYKQYLQMSSEDERQAKFSLLREAVVQYHYMITLRSKYAKGQSLAKRITKQIQDASKKVTIALDGFNSIPAHGTSNLPHRLQRPEVTLVDSPVWQHLAPSVFGPSAIPQTLKRKLIDCLHLKQRATEEIEITSRDFGRLLRSIARQEGKLKTQIELLEAVDEKSTLQKGALALLLCNQHRLKTYCTKLDHVADKVASHKLVTVEELAEDIQQIEMDITKPAELVEIISALEDENDGESLDDVAQFDI